MGATPPRIFHRSFWNHAYMLYIVCKCACGLGLSSFYFLSFFQLCRLSFFPGLVLLIDTFWAQRVLKFSTDHLKLSILVLQSLKICVWFWGYSPVMFYQPFPLFRLRFFSIQISIRIDILSLQFLLDFSTDYLETMHTCSVYLVWRCACGLGVILSLSIFFFWHLALLST